MGVIQQEMGGDASNELEFCKNIHFVDVQANSLFNRLYCQTDILAFLCPLVVSLIATYSNRVSEPSCFFFGLLWTLVTMVMRFPTVINQKEGHVPRGGGGERVRPNNVQFLKIKMTCPYGLNVRIVRGFARLLSTRESFFATREPAKVKYDKQFVKSLNKQ